MSDGDFELPDEIDITLLRRIDAVCTEFDRQWRAGLAPHIKDFLEQIPGAGRNRGLCELIQVEIELRRQAGDAITMDGYLVRFPERETLVKQAFALADPTQILPRPGAAATTQHDAASAPAENVPVLMGRFEIREQIGKGTFGIVYLATDPQFPRLVALKVPRQERVKTEEQRRAFIRDAQIAAALNHPGVVTIHEIDTTGPLPFIVQEYMPGGDLKRRLAAGELSYEQAVAWMIPIAETVAAAHQKHTFHRDLKPANILLDERGNPRVADFGLALHERDQQNHREEFAGTLPYMSPEQVRRESNRLDGRTDTWSLGVIFYEMLTGRRPFLGSENGVVEQIKYREPRPPRELKPDVPAELERICLKCLAKPVAQRYSTAHDLAQDLRRWQLDEEQKVHERRKPGKQRAYGKAKKEDLAQSEKPPRIVPKGLRSFDAHDADFFLDLLPGPRDRNGLPEGVRFWKALIEETDPSQTFTVGILHGPSGCGKSSFLKAGVLPKLASHVVPVFVEATAIDTEVRLLGGLRKVLPEIPHDLPLPDVLAGIRDGVWILQRKKIVIAIDQFEQWLHAGNLRGQAQLVDALRHCDGEHLQCLVLVREDFWTGISRFMQRLEIPIQEQRNAALVDRFDPLHARRVLAEFGRAYGRLPENLAMLTHEQEQFLDAAIDQLSEEGRVICVRLALFSDLFKAKPWTPGALHQAGGASGLGVTFLEETFAAKSAPEAHRRHEKAVRKFFQKLLPESGGTIKGSMQSRQALLHASGYLTRPDDFDELIRILDDQLRLVTPADPEGDFEPDNVLLRESASLPQYYQLTHDYMVPSVRDWLTRKQQESATGRAYLRLSARADLWSGGRETKQLPSWWEWLQITSLTRRSDWTKSQAAMMSEAARHHLIQATGFILLAVVLLWGSWEGYCRLQSESFRDRLFGANLADLQTVIPEILPYRRWLEPLLAENESNQAKALRISLFRLAAGDAGQVDYLQDRALSAHPDELQVIRKALRPYQPKLRAVYWALSKNVERDRSQRLRSACVLAEFDPEGEDWKSFAPDVVAMLTTEDPQLVAEWSNLLRPARKWLKHPLAVVFVERQGEHEGYQAAGVLASYIDDDPAELCRLVLDADARQLRILLPAIEKQRDKGRQQLQGLWEKLQAGQGDEPHGHAAREANLILALDRTGRADLLPVALRGGWDNQVQTQLIHRIGDSGVQPQEIVTLFRLQEGLRRQQSSEYRPDVQKAVLLSLGEYRTDSLTPSEKLLLYPEVLEICENHPDCGVHSAAEWLLKVWGYTPDIGPRALKPRYKWYVTTEGHVMAVIAGQREFIMGGGTFELTAPHRRVIPRNYAISTTKVTNEQFARFAALHLKGWKPISGPACPATNMTWFDAVKYCVWLSEKERLKSCFASLEEIQPAKSLEHDLLDQPGFRLPTEAEWEFACRASSTTSRFFGDDDRFLRQYAWYVQNAQTPQPVGTLKPNRLGLFDVFGNAGELCQTPYAPYPPEAGAALVTDGSENSLPTGDRMMILRGCSWQATADNVRAYSRILTPAARANANFGFRIAQSLSENVED
jgi:serine/threonine protein kinase/formylglycine-generating enzyme required for sulfatase activity